MSTAPLTTSQTSATRFRSKLNNLSRAAPTKAALRLDNLNSSPKQDVEFKFEMLREHDLLKCDMIMAQEWKAKHDDESPLMLSDVIKARARYDEYREKGLLWRLLWGGSFPKALHDWRYEDIEAIIDVHRSQMTPVELSNAEDELEKAKIRFYTFLEHEGQSVLSCKIDYSQKRREGKFFLPLLQAHDTRRR